MNITKPHDMVSSKKVEEAVSKFEEQFKKEEKDQEYYHLVIVGEYRRSICDEVQKIYTDIGWNNVTCRTSSENGERGGLTGLILHR